MFSSQKINATLEVVNIPVSAFALLISRDTERKYATAENAS